MLSKYLRRQQQKKIFNDDKFELFWLLVIQSLSTESMWLFHFQHVIIWSINAFTHDLFALNWLQYYDITRASNEDFLFSWNVFFFIVIFLKIFYPTRDDFFLLQFIFFISRTEYGIDPISSMVSRRLTWSFNALPLRATQREKSRHDSNVSGSSESLAFSAPASCFKTFALIAVFLLMISSNKMWKI